jgi:branched-chain amino acid transport system ATP-binding protein
MRSSGGVPNEGDVFLRLQEVEAVYDGAIVGLRGVTFDVAKGAIVALFGANGAGKTTTLRAISNLLGAENGAVSRGTITWEKHSVLTTHPSQLVAQGLAQVLEGRQCFQHLTVEENLLTGGFVRRLSRSQLREELDRAYTRFPRLKERRHIRAGLISGGEQQMVAIGRALMTGPRLMLLDEPSMGLAPRVVHEIFEIAGSTARKESHFLSPNRMPISRCTTSIPRMCWRMAALWFREPRLNWRHGWTSKKSTGAGAGARRNDVNAAANSRFESERGQNV